MNTEALIEALRRELDGYVRRGMKERADAVRQELVRLGCSPGVTPREVVPSEPDSTPQKAPRRAAKPAASTPPPKPPIRKRGK